MLSNFRKQVVLQVVPQMQRLFMPSMLERAHQLWVQRFLVQLRCDRRVRRSVWIALPCTQINRLLLFFHDLAGAVLFKDGIHESNKSEILNNPEFNW